MSTSNSINESTERIMERVRQRNVELSASMDCSKENSDFSILSRTTDKSTADVTNVSVTEKNVSKESPLSNKTNHDNSAEVERTPSARMRSRFSELAAEYERFEVDRNCLGSGSKPKEAYTKGPTPRLSIGETRPSVLCTPAGMAQLKSSGKSPSSRDASPVKPVTITCNKTPQKLDAVKEEPRRIHFAQPISATHVVEYESSICTTTTNDESTIVAGCGINDTVHSLPVPKSRSLQANKDGEVDMSTDEYGAHTYRKKATTEVKDTVSKDGTVDMSSDEYGAHTFLKKKSATSSETTTSSALTIISPKPFVRGGSQTHFSPVSFNPVKTSSPNCETRTITMHTQMTAQIPLTDSSDHEKENREDFAKKVETRSKAVSNGAEMPKSPSWKRVCEQHEETTAKPLSPIRSAVLESAPAKRIAHQFEEQLKSVQLKIPTPASIIKAPPATSAAPITPTGIPGIQTQWRGSHNTPVVVGSAPGVPIQPDVRASNLKNLKSRWEFSSLTGTPIHPDATEDEIVRAAIRMKEYATPRRLENKPRDPQPYLKKKIEKSVQEAAKRSSLCSPQSKSPRYADDTDESDEGRKGDYKRVGVTSGYSPYKSPAIKVSPWKSPATARKSPHKSPMRIQHPDAAEEANLFGDDEESMDEIGVSHNVSNLIDEAFEFMDGTPGKCAGDSSPMRSATRGMAPKAEEEMFSPVKQRTESLPVPPENAYDDVADCIQNTAVSRVREETEHSKGSLLPYTVSFYRKRMRELRAADSGARKIDLTTDVATAPIQTVIGGSFHEDSDDNQETRKEKLTALEREVSVQQQRISQATHALRYCKEQTEFRGSREEVDAQRALLIATETRRAVMFEIDRLSRGDFKRAPGPRGTITISSITVLLDRDYISSQMSSYCSNRDDIYYFIVLLRYGGDVQHTSLVTSDEGLRKKGLLEFNYYLSLKDLPPDFVCSLDVFGLRTKREHISHEVKYRITGTLSKKQRSKISSTMKTSLGGPSSVMDSAFQLLGQLNIDINTQGRKLMLKEVMHPLDGTVLIKMKKHATEKSQTINRGFLSMYQRTKDGLGTWTRYWCVLEQGEMRFWRSPDEERDGKQWVVLLDLQTCAGEGASTVSDVCPYPNSFHIDVWVPKEGALRQSSSKPELEKLRVMLAADTTAHLDSWLEVINQTTRHVLMWDRPAGMPK